MKWGIEVIRNGDRLEEYHAKFTRSGGYKMWLELGNMSDYILLDCCTSVPRKAYSSMDF